MLDIIIGEHQLVLREKAKPIASVTKEVKKLAKDMEATMLKAKGVGIAAPQVNHSLRLFLAYLNFDTPAQRLEAFINPDITFYSDKTTIKEEGCLSLPGRYGKVQRSLAVTIEYTNLKGQPQTLNLEGMDARIIQHEFDHLNGILFIDRELQKSKAPNRL